MKCDLCGSDDAQPIYRVHDTNYGTPGEFNIVQCGQCTLAFLKPQPTAAELSAAYPGEAYDPFRSLCTSDHVAPHPLQHERARRLTERCGRGMVLDVGCGDGLFLAAMHGLGWTCVGVEPHVRAAESARTRLGLDVRTGDIFSIDLAHAFNLITMWDVLEHTPSPKRVLLYANHLLVPGGMIAISVPNWDSFERQIFRERWIALDAPRHLFHFSLSTITQFLESCGFEIIELKARAPVLSLASNALRLGGDLLYRKGRPAGSPHIDAHRSRSAISSPRRLVIQMTYLGMTPFNALANLLNRGASLLAIAAKVS